VSERSLRFETFNRETLEIVESKEKLHQFGASGAALVGSGKSLTRSISVNGPKSTAGGKHRQETSSAASTAHMKVVPPNGVGGLSVVTGTEWLFGVIRLPMIPIRCEFAKFVCNEASARRSRQETVIVKIDHSISKTALVQEIQLYAYVAGQDPLGLNSRAGRFAHFPRMPSFRRSPI